MSDEPEWRARLRLIAAISGLRYAGSIFAAVPPVDMDETEAEFLDRVTDFLESFNKVLAEVSATTTNMASELQDLRSQRKAVRDFLGLPTTLGDPQ